MTRDELLHHIDAILKASGSGIQHFSMEYSINKMVTAARIFEDAVRADEREKCAKTKVESDAEFRAAIIELVKYLGGGKNE